MKRVSAFSEEMWIRYCISLTRLVRELMKRKLRSGETVLDPFLGTGTTMVAAKKLKRSAIGCEINDKYVSVIKRNVRWGEQSITDDFEYVYSYEVVE